MHAKTDTVDPIKKKNVPGPGNYDLQNSPNARHHRGAAFSLGTSQRTNLAGGKESQMKPGPGNYNSISDMKRSSPKYGFGTERRPEISRK